MLNIVTLFSISEPSLWSLRLPNEYEIGLLKKEQLRDSLMDQEKQQNVRVRALECVYACVLGWVDGVRLCVCVSTEVE